MLKVDNPDLFLRPGMTATADIVVKKVEKAVLVPDAALRFTPPVREEVKKTNGSLIDSLLPHPPHSENAQRDDAAGKKQQRVWALANGEPRAIPVTIGAASGGMSEVTTGEVQPGTVLVIDIIGAAEQS